MFFVKRIKLKNFRRFESFDTRVDKELNVLVGDNESGKSTILLALDLLLSGNRRRIEAISLESLFTKDTVTSFLGSQKSYRDLPEMFVEAYLNDQDDPELNGRINSEERSFDGLRLSCTPNDDVSTDIKRILSQEEVTFPFEYYNIDFRLFSGKPYFGYNRPIGYLSIDSSQINNEYATREYVKDLYGSNVEGNERSRHRNEYRRFRKTFSRDVLNDVNKRIDRYEFAIRTSGKTSLETDLTISEDGIPIEDKGKGQQCFIKTEFALKKTKAKKPLQVLLLEEPENHLSHVNMRKLVRKITESQDKQIFIATHSNLICSRLDLRKCILLNSSSVHPTSLDSVPEGTAEFFMKAADNNILEFILSRKVILVEGSAEYILMEEFYKNETGTSLESSGVHVISIGGTSFKRYLDLSRLLNIKTAVVRDNDGDFQTNCVDNYTEYSHPNIKIFAEHDNDLKTFEICLYEANSGICELRFEKGRRSLTVQDYMLANKTEAAFLLLQKEGRHLTTPGYIQKAIEWIRD